ncbi:uncharacterized protein LOC132601431 [Lycium barbarum]|uniref:uncharacterized protein LOC132601431 n=1 Tax=Lycium barbarum TaxID=112863 RepID=UPI00293E200F|nr:uncharacterized protein LOC132601431 [Lycium barbarum]
MEKYGGVPVQFSETEDFIHCIDTCQLTDLGFKRSMYTWWNGRSNEACIFKRSDRCLGNQALQNLFPNFEVEHLIKQGSDHNPLAISTRSSSTPIKKPFRFLNFWVEHESFLDVVKENWQEWHSADPFFNFQNKLKKRRLQKVQAGLIRFYAIEEKFWKQKTGMQWFADGDRNTKFFHAHVNGKRRRLQLKRIQDHGGDWVEAEEDIVEEAIRFYSDQFREETIRSDFTLLKHIPKMITAK